MAKNFLGSDKVFSISTKGRYALRVMVDLAEQDSTKFITMEEIAVRQEISKKYLEAVLRSLVQNNLLEVLRGRGGGYRLTRKPEEYSVGEILELAEGIMATVDCLKADSEPCPRKDFCKTLPLWKKFDALQRQFFFNITLADLLQDLPSQN